MKRQTTIGKKLFSSFGALIALTVGVGVYAMITITSLDSSIDKLANVNAKKQILLGDLNTRMADLLANERGILLHAADRTGATQYNQESVKSLEAIRNNVNSIEPLIETAQGRQFITNIRKRIETLASTHEQLWQLVQNGKTEQALGLYRAEFISTVSAARASSESLQELQFTIMHGVTASAALSASRSRWVANLAILFSLLLGALVVLVVRGINSALRDFAINLTNTSQQVASASGQIATTSQSLSQGSSEQAASLEEISASMEEITAMSKRNSENSSEVTGMMTETASQVERSNVALQEMVISMNAIKSSGQKVAKIIKTIDEIAFQTNILALNAAVEAARAGEAGMGFAVVADEVRNLAQRSAVAAKDTAALIEEAIANSHHGAEKLEQVGITIRAITESAGKVKHLTEEVSESSKQQTAGIQQASTALTQVSKVTQTAAASAEESAAASEELNAQAQSMRELVHVLNGMVGGHSLAGDTAGIRQQESPRRQFASATPSRRPAHLSTKPEHDPFPMDTVEAGDFRSF